MKITDLKLNPKNPRVIKDHKFQELVKSLKDDPEILSVKKLLYDETNNNIILGGNQRFSALLELGYKDIPEKWLEKGGKFIYEFIGGKLLKHQMDHKSNRLKPRETAIHNFLEWVKWSEYLEQQKIYFAG